MRKDDVAAAFNEWMRRYTEEPEKFKWEWQTVTEFLSQQGAGKTPSYGATCAAYLQQLIEEQRNGNASLSS
jgi:hypothetical protein